MPSPKPKKGYRRDIDKGERADSYKRKADQYFRANPKGSDRGLDNLVYADTAEKQRKKSEATKRPPPYKGAKRTPRPRKRK